MKIDLHCHTEASWDCQTPLGLIPDQCLKQGITVQAITDHHTLEGAQQLQRFTQDKLPQLTIIVGEEIKTSHGELIGLFLQELVPRGLSPEDTTKAIHEQGGLVLLPHGFDPFITQRLKRAAREKIKADIDIVETFNTRVSLKRFNRRAQRWAEEHKKFMSAGSDAHLLKDIGAAWVEVPEQKIETTVDLLKALPGGTPQGIWTQQFIALMQKISSWKF
jgi:predicted metal-dependent phosphoesterase TrpH